MKEFEGKTAVITGAASGIGRGLAERSATLGMNLVLADIEKKALTAVKAQLQARAHFHFSQCSVCLLYTSPSPRDRS